MANNARAFLGELAKEPGNWLSGPEIGRRSSQHGIRFDLVYHRLPSTLKAAITSKPGAGFRLRVRK
jgi:hypothetical protein